MTESRGRRHLRSAAAPGDAPARRVLVVGAGFIGSAAAAALVAHGHKVTALTRSEPRPSRRKLLDGATLVVAESWIDALPNLLVDADDLIYCVGSSSPTESEVDPARDITAVLPPLVRVLELVRLHPTTRLTFLSSGGTVYGEPASVPIAESAPTEPISSYGILKLACENYLRMYRQVHGVDSRVLRVSNPYGPTQDVARGQGLIARLFQNAISGEPVVLFGWGRVTRDYLHIDDLAEAIARIVESDDAPDVLNIGSGVGHTSREVADLVAEVTKSQFEIRYEGPRGYDVEANVLDIERARQLLDFAPRDMRTGLTDTWAAIDPARASARPVPSPRRADVV